MHVVLKIFVMGVGLWDYLHSSKCLRNQATSHLALKPPRVLNASPFFPILHIKEVASSSALRDFVGNLSPPFP